MMYKDSSCFCVFVGAIGYLGEAEGRDTSWKDYALRRTRKSSDRTPGGAADCRADRKLKSRIKSEERREVRGRRETRGKEGGEVRGKEGKKQKGRKVEGSAEGSRRSRMETAARSSSAVSYVTLGYRRTPVLPENILHSLTLLIYIWNRSWCIHI